MSSVLTVVPSAAGGVTYRLYRDEDDLAGMARANAASKQRAGIVEQIDLDHMRHTYRHLVNCDARRDVLLPELDGRIVGYVRRWWSDQHDGSRAYTSLVIVDPVAWGRGVAGTLLDWAEGRHHEVAFEDPGVHATDRPRWLETFAYDSDEEMTRAAEAAAYRVVRRGAEMVRDSLAGDLPRFPLPEGFELRPVSRVNARAVWEAAGEAFSDSFGEAVEGEAEYIAWRDDPASDLSLVVAAYAGDQVAGHVINRLDDRPDGTVQGLLASVATRAPYRRRGLARALVSESLRLLRERGATSAYLGVDLENPRQALTLYESCGFRVKTNELTYRRPFDGRWPEDT